MRCLVGRYPDGSISCCPEMIVNNIKRRIYIYNIFYFSGIIPPPHRIKHEGFRKEVADMYNTLSETTRDRVVTWKKENGWTTEMIAMVMKSAREMEE